MPRAIDLLREGRDEELWQMCCGFLRLDIDEFMDIQKRLLLEQLELLNRSKLGEKIMRGARPRTVEEFRRLVPLTSYKDYCPELIEKREDGLPAKPESWVHTSGKSGEYPYKWVPMTSDYALELSKILYGVGMISCAREWGDTSHIPDTINILYSVAPSPYISGKFAELLEKQSPINYLPGLAEVDRLSFEERIALGFQQAMTQGVDYFFGLSLVLVKVGDKIYHSSNSASLLPYLKSPKALWRLGRGKIRSRLARRPMLPRDLWSLKGIIGSGIDSLVYTKKIREYWGRNPLDLYSCTEGGVIATQAWDYEGMTFVPNLNFLEFIPEDEQLKLQMDRSYKPRTLLLDEVQVGENYELVITNYYGGAMTRYRIGDNVRIQSLRNDKLGIATPQMVFERRVDDVIDFVFVRLTEKAIWQAIEKTGIPYTDWIAYKKEGESVLQVCLEPADGFRASPAEVAEAIYGQIIMLDDDARNVNIRKDFANFIDFKLEVTLLPRGTFSRYTARRQATGADLAHLKPPHVNPPDAVLSYLLAETEEIIEVTRAKISAGIKTTDIDNPDKMKAKQL